MSSQPRTTFNENSAATQNPVKRAGTSKGDRPSLQTFTNYEIQPVNQKEQYPTQKLDLFEFCVSACNGIGGSPGCTGCSYDSVTGECLLFSGQLNEPVARKGWFSGRKTLRSSVNNQPLRPQQSASVLDPGFDPGESVTSSQEASITEAAKGTTDVPSSAATSESLGTSSPPPPHVFSVATAESSTAASTTFLTSTTSVLNFTSISNTTTLAPLPTKSIQHESDFSDVLSQHAGSIAGMLIGCMSALAILAGLVFLFRRHRKRKRARDSQFKVLSAKKIENAFSGDQMSQRIAWINSNAC